MEYLPTSKPTLTASTDYLASVLLTVQTTPPLEDVLVPSYLPATSDFFPAFVSAVDKEGSVWLQRVEGTDPASLDSLVETMTSDYSQLQPEVTTSPMTESENSCLGPVHRIWFQLICVKALWLLLLFLMTTVGTGLG